MNASIQGRPARGLWLGCGALDGLPILDAAFQTQGASYSGFVDFEVPRTGENSSAVPRATGGKESVSQVRCYLGSFQQPAISFAVFATIRMPFSDGASWRNRSDTDYLSG